MEAFAVDTCKPTLVCSSPVDRMAPFFFLIAIRAIDLPLCNFHGPFVSIAEGRDISCKCGLVNLQIECCNVVKESREMNIHCPGGYVPVKLLLAEILVARD